MRRCPLVLQRLAQDLAEQARGLTHQVFVLPMLGSEAGCMGALRHHLLEKAQVVLGHTLATVDLRWTLVTIPGLQRADGAPGDWYIENVEPQPETATAWSPPRLSAQ